MPSVLKPWVCELGLRHQGVLVSAVRGCDISEKEAPGKVLVRAYRGEILISHGAKTGARPSSFIEDVDTPELVRRMTLFTKNYDLLPSHYVLHLMHAAEILGYHHENFARASAWTEFYFRMCSKLHVNPETFEQLSERLNADEETFARQQR